MATKIEWTGETWNPLKGCTPISPGCSNCYAQGIAYRFDRPGFWAEGLTVMGKNGRPRFNGVVEPIPRKLDEPLRWRKPTTVFVNSMADLFHKAVSDHYISAVFGVMGSASRHTFQVLTKRAKRLPEFTRLVEGLRRDTPSEACFHAAGIELESVGSEKARSLQLGEWPFSNVWLGVSVEDAKNKTRIDHLRRTPAAVRFLSCEPLLEDLGELDLTGIDWVIIGGESGRESLARPMKLTWVRRIIAQCREQDVAVFVKQLGAHWSSETLSKCLKGAQMKDWPRDLRIREMPA